MSKSNREHLFDAIKVHICTLSLGELNRLIRHINKDSLEEFLVFVDKPKNKNIKAIYEKNKHAFEEFM